MTVWAVVPVKAFAGAKRRLARVLGPAERAHFARLMLEDVLAVLAAAPGLSGVLAVTDDAAAVAGARRWGAEMLTGSAAAAGHSEAVNEAGRVLTGRGVRAMMYVPGDVPMMTGGDVARLLATLATPPALTLVPAAVEGGTNGALAAPPDLLDFSFGPGSFERHRAAGARVCSAANVLRLPGLDYDMDRPPDLARLLAAQTPSRAKAYLEEIGIPSRIGQLADKVGS